MNMPVAQKNILGRPMVATLSTDHLAHNVQVIQSWAPSAKIIAMVKSNGYGHGIRSVAKRLEGLVSWLGVASINEALALRDSQIRAPLLLMEGVFSPEEYRYAAAYAFGVVIHNSQQVDWLEQAQCAPLAVWIKVDTGMGRLGFRAQEVDSVKQRLQLSGKVQGDVGIMSHFACASDKDHTLNALQINRFSQVRSGFKGPASMCNSAGILNFPHAQFEYVRPGLALYGISPVDNKMASDHLLKPVMTLRSGIIAIRDCVQGDTIGYGADYVCSKAMRVVVIACGYGDGYPQTAPQGTPVLVAGQRCPLVGRVSMDMMTVDISNLVGVDLNSPVTLWGEGLPLEEIGRETGRSPYELLTGVQHRVQFTWEEES